MLSRPFVPVRRFLTACLLACLLAAAALPAAAQRDGRFFGVWEPKSRGAGGYPMKIEPGRITFWRGDEIVEESHYQVIRDFGDRMVVKIWTVKFDKEDHPSNEPWIEVYTVKRREGLGNVWFSLGIEYCMTAPAIDYFFSGSHPGETWRHILEWSARRGEGIPYDHCNMTEDGSVGRNWGGMGFERPVRNGE